MDKSRIVCRACGLPQDVSLAMMLAAPALLEALEEATRMLSNICEGDGSAGQDEDCARFRALIAQVRR